MENQLLKSNMRELLIKDEVLLRYNNKGVIEILNRQLLPYSLRGIEDIDLESIYTWLEMRTININRENATAI